MFSTAPTLLPDSASTADPALAVDVALAADIQATHAQLVAQLAALASLVRRISAAAAVAHSFRGDDRWRGAARGAFDLAMHALQLELAHATEYLRAAERLIEAALYELQNLV